MGPQTEELDLDGIEISVTQLPVMRGYLLLADLSKHALPALAHLQDLAGQGDTEMSEHGDTFAKAADALFKELDRETHERLMLQLFSTCTARRDGKVHQLSNVSAINKAFSGRLFDMVRALRFALEVNFKDFSDAVRTVLGALAPAAKPAPTPKAESPT